MTSKSKTLKVIVILVLVGLTIAYVLPVYVMVITSRQIHPGSPGGQLPGPLAQSAVAKFQRRAVWQPDLPDAR